MIVIWGCSATRAPEFRHRNWCAKRKVTWCQQALGFPTITATTVSNQVATVKGNLSRMTIFRAVPLATPSAATGHAIGKEKPSTNRPPASGRRR